MTSKVRTAVFPVAGMGSRFLPITKAIPKEMLPIVTKPLIQYAVDEALSAGIERIIFVTSSSKRAIEDYFDSNFEVEMRLKAQGKHQELELVRGVLPEHVCFSYIRQKEPLGLGDAILVTKELVGDEPFAILLADDLMYNDGQPVLAQMFHDYSQHGHSVLAVEKIIPEELSKYGIVDFDHKRCIKTIVEKPQAEEAPSHYGVVGRYILTPEIFSYLERTKLGVGGELQLTDAIAAQLGDYPAYAFPFEGKRFDCGHPAGYLDAIMNFRH